MYTAVIRQRGQLTIPDKVRVALRWLREGEVVGIEADQEKVVIKPHVKSKTQFDWDGMWRKIELSRSFIGKRGNLSAFIVRDREDH